VLASEEFGRGPSLCSKLNRAVLEDEKKRKERDKVSGLDFIKERTVNEMVQPVHAAHQSLSKIHANNSAILAKTISFSAPRGRRRNNSKVDGQ